MKQKKNCYITILKLEKSKKTLKSSCEYRREFERRIFQLKSFLIILEFRNLNNKSCWFKKYKFMTINIVD